MKVPQVTPYHVECLLRDHQNQLNDYEQRFLVNAITMIRRQKEFSDRQLDYFDQLVGRLKMWQRIKS